MPFPIPRTASSKSVFERERPFWVFGEVDICFLREKDISFLFAGDGLEDGAAFVVGAGDE